MHTKIYGAWTNDVKDFISALTQDTKLNALIEIWLDYHGATTYQAGQGHFFGQNIKAYKLTESPCTEELFKLSKSQITAGFDAWFLDLKTAFPKLDTPETEKLYKQFNAKYSNSKYDAFIATRAVITRQLVQSSDLSNIDFAIEQDKFLITFLQNAIASMNQHKEKVEQAALPRGAYNPTLLGTTSAKKQVPEGMHQDSACPPSANP